MTNPLFNPWIWLETQLNTLATLNGKLDKLMALVSVEQTDLDTLATQVTNVVAALNAIDTALQNEITALEAKVASGSLPAGSLDGLKAAVASLQAPVTALTALETPTG